MTRTIESRIQELGLVLPPPPSALANYVPFVIADGLLFISGQVPRNSDGSLCVGKIGERFSAEEGYGQARQVGLQMLSILASALDSLDRVERVVKLTAFIHSTLDFTDHARVANGCSDLVAEVFGASGRHARSTVGVSTLPAHVPLEIEAIFQVR